MNPSPVPVVVDIESIVADLNRAGWVDQKVELVTGLPAGYICKSRTRVGPHPRRAWEPLARLWNFWVEETQNIVTVSAVDRNNAVLLGPFLHDLTRYAAQGVGVLSLGEVVDIATRQTLTVTSTG